MSTLDRTDQTVSIHIYGAGYDLDVGYKLNDDYRIQKYTRSDFLNIKDIENQFGYSK